MIKLSLAKVNCNLFNNSQGEFKGGLAMCELVAMIKVMQCLVQFYVPEETILRWVSLEIEKNADFLGNPKLDYSRKEKIILSGFGNQEDTNFVAEWLITLLTNYGWVKYDMDVPDSEHWYRKILF